MFTVLRNISNGLDTLRRDWLRLTPPGQDWHNENDLDLPQPPIFKDDLKWHKPAGAPAYRPKLWDDYASCFNCYTYALRLPALGWGQPGALVSGEKGVFTYSVGFLQAQLLHDGLERIRPHQFDPRGHHMIAAFLSPLNFDGFGDYHFYSLDDDNLWSHKLGYKPVHKYDAEGHAITDVRAARRHYGPHHYEVFAGYYRLPAEGVAYKPICDMTLDI